MFQFRVFLALLIFSSFVYTQVTITPLVLGQSLHSTVTESHWKFFSFTSSAGQGFSLNLVHGPTFDLDVYIRKGSQVPDRVGNYDYKDSGSESNITIEGNVEQSATLYTVGVFGFRGTTVGFDIIAKSGNGCRNGCSGRGTCVRGGCVCNEGYTGDACQTDAHTELTPGVELGPFSLASATWKYFNFNIISSESVSILVTQTTSTGDIDTYVQYGAAPTLVNYRYSNIESYDPAHPTQVITMTTPDTGEWIVGCFAFQASTFKISLNATRGCADNCSGVTHGTCIGSRCSCNRQYMGQTCESFRNNIALSTNYTGIVGRNAWNYYKISAGSLNSLIVKMSHLSGQDCDLYINERENPSLTNYTFRDVSASSAAKITIPNAGNTIHYVGIYGYWGCTYTFNAYLETPNNTCTSANCIHGNCLNGACVCASGYSGLKCDQSDTSLVNGITVTGSVGNGKWAYYNYSFRDTSQIFVVVKELSTVGFLNLYFAYNQVPTLSSYIMREVTTTSNLHRIAVTFSQRTRDFNRNNTLTFILGVYGSTSIPANQAESFKIVAWNPPF